MESYFNWFSENYFRYFDAESTVARSRGEIPSPLANDASVLATFLEYYVDVDSLADRDFANIHALNEPVVHTNLNTKCTEFQEACGRDDVFLPSSKTKIVDFSFEVVSDPVAVAVLSNDAAATSKYEYELYEDQIDVIQKEGEADAFEQDIYNANVGPLHALMSRNPDARSHVGKPLNKVGVRLETYNAAAANRMEDKGSHFLHGIVF